MDKDYLYGLNNNDVAGQGAFSLLCQLHPDVSSVRRFVPLVQNFANVEWSYASSVSEPRASIRDVTDRWQGVYSTAVGIPDEGRNKSHDHMVFKDKVNSRISVRRYGVHKVHILGNKDVVFGDLALLGPAQHSPEARGEANVAQNPFVGVYPVKRRTIFFPRDDELEAVAKKNDKDQAKALCIEYCPWTRIPALALACKRDGDNDVSNYKADYYDAAIAKPEADRSVFEQALVNEYKTIEKMKTEEAYALYQWMMVSQMIGVFLGPGSAKSYAPILLM
jgi:hypothetical protein